MKGRIVIEIGEIPKDCFSCGQVNEYGYCQWINKYIDCCSEIGERYPTCPIELRNNMDEKVKLIKDYARMCESKVGIDCDGCELNKNKKYSSCELFMMKEPEQAVEIIEKWSAEHQIKTRQDMIIKEFPNIGMIGDVIDLRPCDMDTEIECPDRDNTSCTECKKSYWLAEVE